MAQGKTNAEVAIEFYVGPLILAHIYQKLGVENRTEAVSRALEIFGLV